MTSALADADLTAAQAGDLAALNRLIATHRQGVYRYGLHVCRTTEDAEDAVQETLWAATRAIRTFAARRRRSRAGSSRSCGANVCGC